MLDMSLTLWDLGWLAFFVVASIAGIFLIRALIHLGGALRTFSKLAQKNAEGLDKVLADLPALSENAVNLTDIASDIADNLRNEQELIESAIENVCDTIESVSETARTINEDLLGSLKRLAKGILTVVGFITKKKAPEGEADTPDGGMSGAGEFEIGESGGPLTVSESDAEVKPARGRKAAGARKRGEAGTNRKRSAAVTARKKYADKGRNININIR